ncbi:MAG: WbqC family protein [Bacteroidetes bacterium]|nr:WbqC family protein [Bacteroidota bacterium]
MKIAITQPNFIPWLGYFDLLDSIDLWISLDNVQMVKRSFIVRNKIKAVGSDPKWLTVSLKKANQSILINQTELDEKDWHIDAINKIKSYYSTAPFYKKYISVVEEILSPKEKLLSVYNQRTVMDLAQLIGISVEIKTATSLIPLLEGNPEDKIMSLCEILKPTEFYNFEKGIDIGLYSGENFAKHQIQLFKQNYQHPVYTQADPEFSPYLSILDLLFNMGENSLEVIRKGRNWVKVN